MRDFDSILVLYNKLICTSVEKIRQIAAGQGFTDSRQNYNERRERYISYLNRYIEFSEKMNHQLGEKYFRAYFDLPREL